MADFSTGNIEHSRAGLAGDIRALIESDQFDLGGYTESRARDLIVNAFGTPLSSPMIMIKVTFVVGGGKLVRSRYSEDLTKWVVAALREIGYSEDRSAAETFDSQGTFKQQHDTGQNLKYLIVYPKILSAGAAAKDAKPERSQSFDETSPDHILYSSEFATFKDIISAKVISYKQKEKALSVLKKKWEGFKAIEAKLITGALLDQNEQALYDASSGSETEKFRWLQDEMKSMIDKGNLTTEEKESVLQSLEAAIVATQQELSAAQTENKPKKAEKLAERLTNLTERKTAVSKIESIRNRLRLGDEIQVLHMRLRPLIALEEKGRSMSLTLADLRVLEEKPALLDEIARLEKSSLGWFEDPEDFDRKCKYEQKQAEIKYNKRVDSKKLSSTSNKSGGVSQKGSSTAWSAVAAKPSKTASSSTVNQSKKTTANGFAAAFNDDSD